MFFRRKRREAEEAKASAEAALKAEAAVEGTAPDLVEAEDALAEASAIEETVAASVIQAKGEEGDRPQALMAVADDGVPSSGDMIRLFPGFERDDFEVGFRADKDTPSLVIRWKDGGEWFAVPPLFNRGVLAAMDERDSASDLNRLLRNYGYDVDAIHND